MKVLTAHFLLAAEDKNSYPKGGRREIAFAGRSNVGKSSMINTLLGRRNLVRTSKTPGRTRKLNFFLINERFVFVDFPGYGFASVSQMERAKWATMIETYLRVRQELAGVVLIVDSRRLPTDLDMAMIQYLSRYHIPFVVAVTKADKLNHSQMTLQTRLIHNVLGDHIPVIVFSAHTGLGKNELWREIIDLVENEKDIGIERGLNRERTKTEGNFIGDGPKRHVQEGPSLF